MAITKDELEECLARGDSIQEIATLFGVVPNTVIANIKAMQTGRQKEEITKRNICRILLPEYREAVADYMKITQTEPDYLWFHEFAVSKAGVETPEEIFNQPYGYALSTIKHHLETATQGFRDYFNLHQSTGKKTKAAKKKAETRFTLGEVSPEKKVSHTGTVLTHYVFDTKDDTRLISVGNRDGKQRLNFSGEFTDDEVSEVRQLLEGVAK